MSLRIQVSLLLFITQYSTFNKGNFFRFGISQDIDDVKIYIWTSRNKVEYKTVQIGKDNKKYG